MSVNRACSLAGIGRRTLYNWMAKDKVEFIRTAGLAPRIFLDTLFRTADTPTNNTGNANGHKPR